MDDLKEQELKGGAKLKGLKGFFFDWVIPIVIALIIALGIQRFVIFKVKIPTGSMIPTIQIGDRIFATRVYNLSNIERGEILIFESEELNDTLIKRVIGLPGDKIVMKDGVVTVNGEVLEEEYIENIDLKEEGEFEVPEGKYFFLGDNRPNSYDSSKWNNPYIDESNITGKAFFKVYPFNKMGKVK